MLEKIEELKAAYTDNYLKTGQCPDEIVWHGKICNQNWVIRINITVVECTT
jgi:hypothetical protein